MFAKLSLLAFLTLIVTAAIVMAAEQGAPSRAAPAQPPPPAEPRPATFLQLAGAARITGRAVCHQAD